MKGRTPSCQGDVVKPGDSLTFDESECVRLANSTVFDFFFFNLLISGDHRAETRDPALVNACRVQDFRLDN